ETEKLEVWKEGYQKPSCYDPCEAGEVPMTSVDGGHAEYSGLSMSGTQTSEEAMEANTWPDAYLLSP
ncbi:MAG TPA: hypothetical protein VED41_09780, partial [Solirubrobacteraceae bacterium]|nr:hypothetical protein [Solirubrobacteraceae bacterium]